MYMDHNFSDKNFILYAISIFIELQNNYQQSDIFDRTFGIQQIKQYISIAIICCVLTFDQISSKFSYELFPIDVKCEMEGYMETYNTY